ncbi:PP2C family protein-serine/threonine phosphatase [Streptomyces sp. TRM70308]|uniref:PP2C family protein-serine/threonine phosphatase n=1 Tax=Streptomyces sp. TRM70308 TaxID=3131932 RepID=UPI003CFE0CB9
MPEGPPVPAAGLPPPPEPAPSGEPGRPSGAAAPDSRRCPDDGTPPPPAGGGAPEPELLDLVDQAVVVCDAARVVVRRNRSAADFFPRLCVGEVLSEPVAGPLARAAASGRERFDADFGGRRLAGHVRRWRGQRVWLVRDDSAVREREDALRAERSRAAFLTDVGKRLGATLHHGRTARTVVRLAVPVLADAATVVLPLHGRRTAWHRYDGAETGGSLGGPALRRAPRLADALSGLDPQPVECTAAELAPLGDAVPGALADGGQGLVIPLPGNGVPAGALLLVRGPGREAFSETDHQLAGRFAARAGIALAAAAFYSAQSHTASVLQAGLEPEPLPRVPGLRLGAAYRPAQVALYIGGDFYHVTPSAAGGVDFFFGDVCGKGVEAAVLTGRVRQSLAALALVETRPVRSLHLLNQSLLDSGNERFTTLVTGSARPVADGGVEVTAAGGGHLPPLVLRADGTVEAVEVGGTLVGALPDPVFDQVRVRLAPGEVLVLYSDGVTEARGGPEGDRMFGQERLTRHLAESCRGLPAGAVAERVELLTTEWLGDRPHDDIAVLALQAPPARGARP